MIYAFSNHKGGVGKTTSTINVGAVLAKTGKKVLLIDLDPQANLSQSLSVSNDTETTIYNHLKGDKNFSPIEYKKNLHVIPSSLDLSVAELELNTEPGREYILKEFLSGLAEKYDYVFIDCPPSLGLLTINALVAARYALIPMQAEYLPMRGLAKLTEIISKIQKRLNKELEIGCVFLTQYDVRKILNRDIAESVSAHFKHQLLDTRISNNVTLAEAPSSGKDILSYDKNCKGALDYTALVKEMIQKAIL